jgi:predicted nucleic acid-binding protein
MATHAEVLHLVDAHRLHGRGIGWIDAHLLASAMLTGLPLWTRDGKLNQAAKALGIAEKP